jgi:heme/copper-type cytochrome/quinol oxidase subunit 1
MYIGVSLVFALGALVLGALSAADRIAPRDDFLGQSAIRLTTLGALGAAFLVVVPLLLGLAIAVTPLQVGARSLAFPRAAALSFWAWLGGAGLMIGAVAAKGGPGDGSQKATLLFLLGFGLSLVALLVAAVATATTVLTLRTRGMYLDRVPFFSWSMFVTATMLVVTLPVLVGVLIFQYVQIRYGSTPGSVTDLWTALSWSIRQPMTMTLALPALGIIADTMPVFARSRQAIPEMVYGAIALGGILGFGAFAQDALMPEVRLDVLFQLVSIAALLPILMVLGLIGLTMKSGKTRVGAPLIFATCSMLLLLGGAAVGALIALEPLHLVGTSAEQAQTDLMLFGALLAGMGGVVYWAPKLFGRLLPEGPTRGLATLGFLGTVLAAVSNLILGWAGDQPAWAAGFGDKRSYTGVLNTVVAVGYGVLFITVAGFLLLALTQLKANAQAVADDPWDGHTLEWATSSPPVLGNFAQPLENVTSAAPLLDWNPDRMEVQS